jgi:hypothetical protein
VIILYIRGQGNGQGSAPREKKEGCPETAFYRPDCLFENANNQKGSDAR